MSQFKAVGELFLLSNSVLALVFDLGAVFTLWPGNIVYVYTSTKVNICRV
jgi:hypothetical protein